MFLKDTDTGKPSVTLTMFVYGFIIVTIKLLVAGLTIGAFKMTDFSGVDYAAAVAALGGVYGYRKGQKNDKDSEKGE